MIRRPPRSTRTDTLFPYTTLFRSNSRFNQLGARVVGVTAGNIDRVAEFSKSECRSKFAVAADPGAKVAAKYDTTMPGPGQTTPSDRTSFVLAPDRSEERRVGQEGVGTGRCRWAP